MDAAGQRGWEYCALDDSSAPAKKGRPSRPLARGQNQQAYALVEGHGLPLAPVLTSSQVHALTAAGTVFASVRVLRPRAARPGAPDRGYNNRAFREDLRRRGIRHSVTVHPPYHQRTSGGSGFAPNLS